MNRALFVVAVLTCVLAGILVGPYSPLIDQPELKKPEPLHHVVFVSVCGELELAVVTINPPLVIIPDTVATQEEIKLVTSAHDAGRESHVQLVGPGCPSI